MRVPGSLREKISLHTECVHMRRQKSRSLTTRLPMLGCRGYFFQPPASNLRTRFYIVDRTLKLVESD